MSPLLILYIAIAFAGVVTAGIALVELNRRRRMLSRAAGEGIATTTSVLRPESDEKGGLTGWLERLQEDRAEDEALSGKLVQAGYEGTAAVGAYFVFRLASIVLLPLVTLLLMPRERFSLYAFAIVIAVFIGVVLPMALLDRTIRLRQERIRRAVPDALDLLVVCVEAGVSLDAAILRVAKELQLVHDDLAHELNVVNRLTNAGVPREQALRGLWQRTGVEDIRALVSSLIQSEKWGTSVATVLRVAAETLRRKRRQIAERKAKQAPLKMTFPLLFFILPALFTVIMGPAVATIIKEFGRI